MNEFDRKKFLSGVKRVVVKIGSSVLTGSKGGVLEMRFGQIASQVVKLQRRGIEVIIVSSGAIASGMKKLNLKKKPPEIHVKQAIAACGQHVLMSNYEKAFSKLDTDVAQILLTHDGLSDRKRFLIARKTVHKLLEMNIVPIVNENDSVSVDEIMIGDNDNLASLVTSLTQSDLMVLLTNIGGIYRDYSDENAHAARLISLVTVVDKDLESIAGGTTGSTTTGGMVTKIEAIRKVSAFGVPSIIADGGDKDVLLKIFEGENTGTFVLPSKDKLSARKHWIVFNLQTMGEIVVDEGAKVALVQRGKSLLPSGIKEVRGKFGIGDTVLCRDVQGSEIAKGITSYNSVEIERIAGVRTSRIEGILGYKYSDEVIHRDDLVITSKDSD